ncbi:MAG: M23 family metallopeptidase [Desulfuromonadales bacterium]|nr:M23 family metallopeptidase [Desulfuromonadales bacterium]
MKKILLFIILLGLVGVAKAELRIAGTLTQGGLFRGQVTPGTQIYYGQRRLKVSEQGGFILGFARDAETSHTLTLIDPSGLVSFAELQIESRNYRIQRINGISKRMMEPNPADLRRIDREAEQARRARRLDSDLPYFTDSFVWPVIGRISGVYGSRRILNGEPRRPHFGVDIAAPTGTPVKAPAGGRVTLAHKGMFFSGATLIIDHGHGLSSSFLHLQQILVKEGQLVTQGQRIATVGATGRVTGPHLDWRINWFEQRLDPALLVPDMPGG